MIKFDEFKNIYIYSECVDMRMGLNKIQLTVALNFSKIEIRHSVFVFCSRDRKQIKIYYEDDYGSWLLQNKLHDKSFKWPKLLDNTKITKNQLIGLCKGLEVIESYKENSNISYNYY